MELRQLQYFIAVADALNFSRAAESLYITQPTLSQQISELEKELGVDLFIRTKRSVLLTPAGASLLQNAKDLLHRSETIISEIRQSDSNGAMNEHICIGYEPSVIKNPALRFSLTNAVATLRLANPCIRAFFRILETDQLEKALRTGLVDIGFALRPESELEHFNSRVMQKQNLLVGLYSQEPIPDTEQNLISILESRKVFILEKEMKSLAQALKLFSQLNVSPSINFIQSDEVISLLVESGDGVMLIPSGAKCCNQNPNLRFLSFQTHLSELNVLAVWDKENMNSLIQHILDSMTGDFPDAI